MSEYGYALERICKIMDNIEKDLHSIDISFGKIVAQNEKKEAKNDKNEPKNDFKIVPDKDILGEYAVTRNECESEISKYQQQMVEKVVSDMHAYMNREENDENRS